MSKITRETMLVFAASAGANQLEIFGSLAEGSATYLSPGSAAIPQIQSLSNYLEGWFGGVVGSNLPGMQDLNAICYLYAYQLAYLFQAGIPEWDSGTTYYIGSFVQVSGVLYSSLIDNNTNNAVTTSDWLAYTTTNNSNMSGTGTTYTMTSADNGKTFLVDNTGGSQTFTLPAPARNFRFTVKDATGFFDANNCIINPHASEHIEGQNRLTMTFPYGFVEIESDGTNWFVVAQGKLITQWVTFTPTILGITSPTLTYAAWRRSGDTMELTIAVNGGTGTGTTFTAALPKDSKANQLTMGFPYSGASNPICGDVFMGGNSANIYKAAGSFSASYGAIGISQQNVASPFTLLAGSSLPATTFTMNILTSINTWTPY